jgi:hypothetical protein
MKRLALVLAAVLASGCVVIDDDDPCVGTVTLEWDFQLANGAVPAGTISQICAVAGVTWVDVLMNGQPVLADGFWCTEGGATVIDVPQGSYLFTVEGVDAAGLIRYRHEFEVDSHCGDQFLATRPAAGLVNLDYSLPGGLCTIAGTFMHFDIRDEITGERIPEQTLSPVACGPDALVRALPAGLYTLEWMEERATSDPSSAVYRTDCTFRPFEIRGGLWTDVFPAVQNASLACPHYQ